MKLLKGNTIVFILPLLALLLIGCTQSTSTSPSTSIPSTGYTVPSRPYDTPTPTCISSQESWNNIGKYACVEYHVGYPFKSSKGNVFLNERSDYKNGFSTVIYAYATSSFGDPISKYGYKTIRVTGLIKTYEGHPEIIVNNPANIVIVR